MSALQQASLDDYLQAAGRLFFLRRHIVHVWAVVMTHASTLVVPLKMSSTLRLLLMDLHVQDVKAGLEAVVGKVDPSKAHAAGLSPDAQSQPKILAPVIIAQREAQADAARPPDVPPAADGQQSLPRAQPADSYEISPYRQGLQLLYHQLCSSLCAKKAIAQTWTYQAP